jgi:hypothetical protein
MRWCVLFLFVASLFSQAQTTTTTQPGAGGGSSFSGGAAGASFQDITEIAAPANPAAGVERVYSDSTTHLLTCLRSSGASCFSAGGSIAFSAITSGTNSAPAAMVEGAGSSLVTASTGQVTANGQFLTTGGVGGVPIPTNLSISGSQTGGNLASGHTIYIKATFSIGAAESFPSLEQNLPEANAAIGCNSGTVCQITIAGPTFSAPITGWTLYDVFDTPGGELKQAALSNCVNLASGVNCVINTLGAGSAPPATQSPTVLPSPLGTSYCSSQGQPFQYILKSDGLYHATAMVDEISTVTQAPNGPIVGGQLHWCDHQMWDDSGYLGGNLNPGGTGGRASAWTFFHVSGINNGQGCCPTGSNQDDRSLSLFNQDTVGDASVRTGMQIGIYNESGIIGHPAMQGGVGLNPAFTNGAVRSNCYVNSDQNNFAATGPWGCHQAHLELDNGHLVGGTSAAMTAIVQINGADNTHVLQAAGIAGYYSQLASQICSNCLTGTYASYWAAPPISFASTSLNLGYYHAGFSSATSVGFRSDQDGTAGSLAFTATNAASTSQFGRVQSVRYSADIATTLVTGDFVLSAGWGTTASIAITNAKSKDSAAIVTVTSAGTGQAANPTIAFTFHDGTWTNTPACIALQSGGNDIFGDSTTTVRSATAQTWQWNATPTATKTYEFTITCTGT